MRPRHRTELKPTSSCSQLVRLVDAGRLCAEPPHHFAGTIVRGCRTGPAPDCSRYNVPRRKQSNRKAPTARHQNETAVVHALGLGTPDPRALEVASNSLAQDPDQLFCGDDLMTTTPTVWGNKVPFSNFFTDFGPQVIGAERRHLRDRHGNAKVEISSAGISMSSAALPAAIFCRPVRGDTRRRCPTRRSSSRPTGSVVSQLYGAVRTKTQQDMRWHQVRTWPRRMAPPSAWRIWRASNEFLQDSTATAGGGSAHVFGVVGRPAASPIWRSASWARTAEPLSDRILLDMDPGKLEQNRRSRASRTAPRQSRTKQIDQTTFDRQIQAAHPHTQRCQCRRRGAGPAQGTERRVSRHCRPREQHGRGRVAAEQRHRVPTIYRQWGRRWTLRRS